MLDWHSLENSCRSCSRCDLCKPRHNVVFGVGPKDADILFIVNGQFFRGLGRLIVDFFKNLARQNAFIKKLEEQ